MSLYGRGPPVYLSSFLTLLMLIQPEGDRLQIWMSVPGHSSPPSSQPIPPGEGIKDLLGNSLHDSFDLIPQLGSESRFATAGHCGLDI